MKGVIFGQLEDLYVCVQFDVMENIAVRLLVGKSVIYFFVKKIFLMQWPVAPIQTVQV